MEDGMGKNRNGNGNKMTSTRTQIATELRDKIKGYREKVERLKWLNYKSKNMYGLTDEEEGEKTLLEFQSDTPLCCLIAVAKALKTEWEREKDEFSVIIARQSYCKIYKDLSQALKIIGEVV